MRYRTGLVGAGLLLLLALGIGTPTCAQKPGGILPVHALDSPPSLPMHEEVDANPARAAMGIFNNLVMFDQHIAQNRLDTIVPDLASEWSWNEDGTVLTFKLRQGVKWRRQAVHRQGCQMHLGHAAGKGSGKAQDQPAQSLVPEPR